ncbi:hypothetical protein D6764_01895 [Candidatus Woesearchaeota archaeon]|nr:MAG: hypothetical protein D6764_01895 [Candidatus Woesearchaeota archaeon]
MLLAGVVLVSAGSYYSIYSLHKSVSSSDDFEAMHSAMMQGDFKTAEKYHEQLDFECPMHELVKQGDISLEDFQTMHGWMMSGNFPEEKPAGLSDAAWELHKSHHPEIYK